MIVGDFVSEYESQRGLWDCVVTCFFSDTECNVLEYVDTIGKTLRVGGVWVHYGPKEGIREEIGGSGMRILKEDRLVVVSKCET